MMSKRQHQQLLKAGTPSASTDDPQAFDRLPSLPSAHTFVAKFSPRIGGPANKLFIAIVLLLTLFVDSMEAAITGEMESYPENRLTEILNSVPSFDSVEQEEASQVRQQKSSCRLAVTRIKHGFSDIACPSNAILHAWVHHSASSICYLWMINKWRLARRMPFGTHQNETARPRTVSLPLFNETWL